MQRFHDHHLLDVIILSLAVIGQSKVQPRPASKDGLRYGFINLKNAKNEKTLSRTTT
jgi:hypothetical protein